MDTQKCNLGKNAVQLPELSGEGVVVGAKQLRKALKAGRNVRRVFLAKNADPALTEPLEALCHDNRIECAWVRSMSELGRACGIEVGAATAAVVD